jgi:hypothetical protein
MDDGSKDLGNALVELLLWGAVGGHYSRNRGVNPGVFFEIPPFGEEIPNMQGLELAVLKREHQVLLKAHGELIEQNKLLRAGLEAARGKIGEQDEVIRKLMIGGKACQA